MSISAATRTATIVVPMLPPREVSPNWYGSWRQKARAVREFRETAGWATRQVYTPYDGVWWQRAFDAGVIMDFEVAWCCRRKRMDDGNCKAAMKALVDGIADVLWEGNDAHVTIGTVTQTRGDGTVTVTLRGPA